MKRVQLATEELLSNIKSEHHLEPGSIIPLSSPGDPTPIVGETYSRSLDDSATLVLNLLTPSIRDYAFELADITLKIPRWQLLLGSMLAQYEGGALTNPSIDPSWRQAESVMSDSICQLPSCQKHFIPKRYGQKYCGTACGDEARKADIIEMKRKKREAEIAERKLEEQMGIRPPEFRDEE